MASGWKRTLGKLRSFSGNSMGGLRGTTSLASWVVSGTIAYFLWIRPSQQLRREQEEKAALAAPDLNPRDTGLLHGNKNRGERPE